MLQYLRSFERCQPVPGLKMPRHGRSPRISSHCTLDFEVHLHPYRAHVHVAPKSWRSAMHAPVGSQVSARELAAHQRVRDAPNFRV
jgi:hypothetical protein